MKKCIMIYNGKSGKNKSNDLIDKFKDIIGEYKYDLKIIYTKRKGHASKIVRELPDDIDLVISAGGDGTLNEVIRGNLKRDKKLLISQIPLGTTNDLGTMYGYNSDYVNDLKMLLNGEEKNIDVCTINKLPFTYCACIGSFVDVSYDTPRRLKEKYGRIGYIIYGLKELKGKLNLYNIRYKVDNRWYTGKYSFIFITNSSRIAGVDGIYNDVKLDDNKFEVLLCKVKSKVSLVKILYLLKTKDVSEISDCEYYKTNNLEIIFDEIPNSWCLDGEEFRHKNVKFKFDIIKDINMLIPRKNIDKLFIDKE